MKHRKLRIAWSVTWGIVALLMIALWVRSYSYFDSIMWSVSTTRVGPVDSCIGGIYLHAGFELADDATRRMHDSRSSFDLIGSKIDWLGAGPFATVEIKREASVSVPDWIAVTFCLLIGVAPLFRQRFSLRTLLIATTLVAVGLGLIVWAAK